MAAGAPKSMPLGSKCAKCKETLGLRAVHACGSYYHGECFACAGCNEKIADLRFHENQSKPYCHKCYLEKFAPKCFDCKQPLDGALYVTMLDHDYHQQCTKCSKCRRSLAGGQYFEFENQAYCLECHWKARIEARGAKEAKQPTQSPKQPNPSSPKLPPPPK